MNSQKLFKNNLKFPRFHFQHNIKILETLKYKIILNKNLLNYFIFLNVQISIII